MRCIDFLTVVFCILGFISCTRAQEVAVASISITNADTVTYMVNGPPQTITVTLGLTTTGGNAASITKIDVYFTDNAQYESATPAKTSAAFQKMFATAISVADGVTDDKTKIQNEEVVVSIDDAKCAGYTHVCVVVTATGDSDSNDDDGCLPFGTTVDSEAGKKQCTAPGVKAGSFSATDPTSYTIDTTTPVAFTFSIGLTNADATNSIVSSAINVHLSDDESLTTSSMAVPAAGVTFPITIEASADGSSLTTGLTASITADVAQCDSYKYVCAQVIPGNAIACFSIGEKINCPDMPPPTNSTESGQGGSASMSVPWKYGFLVNLLVAVKLIL